MVVVLGFGGFGVGFFFFFFFLFIFSFSTSTYPVPFPLGIAQDLSGLSGFLLLSWIRGKDVTSELVSLLITLETVMLIEIRQKFLMKRGRTKLKIKNTGNK